jgi:hypothetical protein
MTSPTAGHTMCVQDNSTCRRGRASHATRQHAAWMCDVCGCAACSPCRIVNAGAVHACKRHASAAHARTHHTRCTRLHSTGAHRHTPPRLKRPQQHQNACGTSPAAPPPVTHTHTHALTQAKLHHSQEDLPHDWANVVHVAGVRKALLQLRSGAGWRKRRGDGTEGTAQRQ